MLDENMIVDAVCRFLENRDYAIEKRASTTEKGIDIIAKHKTDNEKLLIEAKGGTSSRQGSNRYGKPYTNNQVFDRISKGLFSAVQMHCEYEGCSIGLAFPKTKHFMKYLDSIKPVILKLGFRVYLVSENRDVEIY